MRIRKLILAIVICLVVLSLLPVHISSIEASGTCNGVLHVVQIGENLYRISLAYGVPMSAIANANGITNYSLIYAGSTLCIPGATTTYPTGPATYPTAPTTYPGVVVIPVTVTTYPTYPAYPAYPTAPATSPYMTVAPNGYFKPCILGVECRPDQTQYMYYNGREICVAAKFTAYGLGWVEADRSWCRWIDVFRAANPLP